MTQEDKELLLKDLCARLPYGVNCDRLGVIRKVLSISPNRTFCVELDNGEYVSNWYSAEDIKPYLRPMSSMTEEEDKEYTNIDNRSYSCPKDYAHIPAQDRIDWFNKHHFDYRGLIEKGLALPAPEEMYNC